MPHAYVGRASADSSTMPSIHAQQGVRSDHNWPGLPVPVAIRLVRCGMTCCPRGTAADPLKAERQRQSYMDVAT
jgi:hypothetical protein